MNGSREFGIGDSQSIGEGLGSSTRERSISPDAILSAVANDHRRAILHTLENAPEKTLAYDVLVDRVADCVRDEGAKQEVDEHRQRVRIALHHTHLPTLVEARMIDYEAETGNVEFVGGELEQDLVARVESNDPDE